MNNKKVTKSKSDQIIPSNTVKDTESNSVLSKSECPSSAGNGSIMESCKAFFENRFVQILIATAIFAGVQPLSVMLSTGTGFEYIFITLVVITSYLFTVVILLNKGSASIDQFNELYLLSKQAGSGSEIDFAVSIRKSIISRIELEITRLTKRSYLNLCIGGVSFAVGLAILLSSGEWYEASSQIQEILPRISVVALTEIVVIFFLSFYKRNLDDIKYYQNELTNVDFKILSILNLNRNEKDEETAKALIQLYLELAKTERNPSSNSGKENVKAAEPEQEKGNAVKTSLKKIHSFSRKK